MQWLPIVLLTWFSRDIKSRNIFCFLVCGVALLYMSMRPTICLQVLLKTIIDQNLKSEKNHNDDIYDFEKLFL